MPLAFYIEPQTLLIHHVLIGLQLSLLTLLSVSAKIGLALPIGP